MLPIRPTFPATIADTIKATFFVPYYYAFIESNTVSITSSLCRAFSSTAFKTDNLAYRHPSFHAVSSAIFSTKFSTV